MSFAENNNGFTPSFVSLALSGETHRFILVLECESRQYEGEVAVSHPRFCVGGPRATLDPRNVSINDLLPLGASKVDLPPGWEKVHQLLYGKVVLNCMILSKADIHETQKCIHTLR